MTMLQCKCQLYLGLLSYIVLDYLQAARDGKIDVIRQRLHKLGKNSARRLKAINKADEDNITPLHYAIRYGHVEVVKLLVECGAGKVDFMKYFQVLFFPLD